MSPGTLIVRADASVAMGTGHVMRCLALAQAWQDEGGHCIFAMAETTPALQERVRAEKFDVCVLAASPASLQDAALLVKIAATHHADWVVVDGYKFDVQYQRNLKAGGLKLLLVDDTGHAGAYVADLVLDQNAHASENFYQRREPHTRLLLGPRYAMLRREFRPWMEWKREVAPLGRRVLVAMGGSDPQNLTLQVMQALKSIGIQGIEVAVVTGGSNPHTESIEQTAADGGAVRLHKNATNMAELMAWADVAVSAAGTICWEMCLLGLPAILVDLAENQRPVARDLDRRGAAIYLGSEGDIRPREILSKLESLLLSSGTRSAMSRRGRSLVDGRGAERVISAMRSAEWRLRRAQPEDVDLLWNWANDPDVRAASFSSQVITQESHREWFGAKLANSNAVVFLAVDAGNSPVGVVRYDIEKTRAFISITLAREFRGKGHGKTILGLAVEELFRSTRATVIDAYVKPMNEASLQLFTRSGFRREKDGIFSGQPAVHFTLKKNQAS